MSRGQDATKHPTMHRTATHTQMICSIISVVLKLRTSDIIQPVLQIWQATMTQRDNETYPGPYNWLMVKLWDEKYPLKPSTMFLPDLKLLISQRTACYEKDGFNGNAVLA